jgi:hypothetical protein
LECPTNCAETTFECIALPPTPVPIDAPEGTLFTDESSIKLKYEVKQVILDILGFDIFL